MLCLWFNSDLLYLNYVILGTGCYRHSLTREARSSARGGELTKRTTPEARKVTRLRRTKLGSYGFVTIFHQNLIFNIPTSNSNLKTCLIILICVKTLKLI